MTFKVPFVDPRLHYARLKPEIDSAILGCLSRGDLIERQQLRDFEEHFASFVGTKFAIGVSSGFHALHFSLLAAGVCPGDEVITVAHTFLATISAIIHCGATPILVDVGTDYNLDPEQLECVVGPKTKAVLPVHLNGRVCDMDAIQAIAEKHGLVVIEDAAQAVGAAFDGRRAGSWGRTGCFSFYPFKSLGGFGDGGAVTTNDPQIAETITFLRRNGEDRQHRTYHLHGYTALLDNVQAAVLDVKLRWLPRWIEHRREMAQAYHDGLRDIAELSLPHFSEERRLDSFQNYVIRTKLREPLRDYLTERGIETMVSWPQPIWAYEGLKLGRLNLPTTEAVCREVLSLPLNSETSLEQVKMVVEVIHEFFAVPWERGAAEPHRLHRV